MYQSQGRWKEANKLLVQVHAASLKVFRTDHPDTLRSTGTSRHYIRGGSSCFGFGHFFRLFVANHPDTLTSTRNPTSIYSNQGRREAEELPPDLGLDSFCPLVWNIQLCC